MSVPTVKSLIILLMQPAIFFTITALSGLKYIYFISTVRCCVTVLKLVRKTMLMQNFWGQTRCVRDNAKVAIPKLWAGEHTSNFVHQVL